MTGKLFTLINLFFVGFVNYDLFDDITISDGDIRELANVGSASQTIYGN